jgi:TonB family protein
MRDNPSNLMKKTLRYFLLAGLFPFSTLAAAVASPPSPGGIVYLRFIKTIQPAFPPALLDRGLTHGVARVALSVDAGGHLEDALVVAYTQPEFAEEALRVVRAWRYEPTRIDGIPVGTVAEFTWIFKVDGVLTVMRFAGDKGPGGETERERQIAEYQYQPCSLGDLDRIPTPMHVVAPTYPREWAAQGLKGAVAVNFYIDETGKTRMATAEATADPRLAAIAVAAVEQWSFAPPTKNGGAVLVRTQQVFKFGD